MKIALIGYGKMGQTIEKMALQRGHEIVLKINSDNRDEMNETTLSNCDVAIEFTNPEAAKENVSTCFNAKLPTVCGTTGWASELNHAKMLAIENEVSFLHTTNFSIGVNLFFEINKLLAKLMNEQNEYEISLKEVHHTHKKDAPSGTAISLAEQILSRIERKEHWTNQQTDKPELLFIESERTDQVPGTHHVKYDSSIDSIEIIHTAHNRDGFALGAVLAAEFIVGKKGIFTMQDVLGIH